MFKGKIGWFSAEYTMQVYSDSGAKDNKYRTTYNNLVGLYGENQTRPVHLSGRNTSMR